MVQTPWNSSSLMFLSLLMIMISSNFCKAESSNVMPEDTRRWSNGVGLWGKRSVGNAEFDGITQRAIRLVNKRPEDSWHKLNSLWGKRAAPSASNWQTATGLWGKRSAPPLPPAWRQIADDGGANANYELWLLRNLQ